MNWTLGNAENWEKKLASSSAFQTANILLHFGTVAVIGTYVKYVAVEILCLSYHCLYCERLFFTSVPTVVCVGELCSCLCIQWPERDKGWER